MIPTIEEINNAPIGTIAWVQDYNRGSGEWVKIHNNVWRAENLHTHEPPLLSDENMRKRLERFYNNERAEYEVGLTLPK